MDKAPMGWNSYDYYDTTVTEKNIRDNALYMAKHLRQFGWEYVIIDIEWYSKDAGSMREKYQYIPFGDIEMDAYGRLQPAVNRFPSSAGGKGFTSLAEYVHSLGLKFGIHIMRGIPREAAHRHLPIWGSEHCANEIADPSSICKWNPDMYGIRSNTAGAQEYYDSLINMYAEWGVDFIKCDDICNTNLYVENPYSAKHEIEMLHSSIKKCGRKMVLSLSPGPALIEKAWHYKKNANMWRITDDFWDNWESLINMFDRCELWQNHVCDGAYPDCDMLPVGIIAKGFGKERETFFTHEEQKTMMTLWCIFGSPLMIGAELTKLDSWTLFLLTNSEVLKLVQNGYVGRQFEKNSRYAIWSSLNIESNEKYVAFFNFESQNQVIRCNLTEIEQFQGMQNEETAATELWEKRVVSVPEHVITESIPAHGARIYKLGK